MLKVAVCDDLPQELERSCGLLRKYAGEHLRGELEAVCFSNPLELLAHVSEKGGFDILLLDVYMPGLIGTETARELRAMGDQSQIIFLTTSRDHAVDAFSVNAAHYLVKPYAEQELFTALDKAVDSLARQQESYITVKSTDGIRRIDLGRLVYAETENHMQKLYGSDGQSFCVRKSSTELFELLEEEPRFYKCGSTYIVNMDYIIELTSRSITFSTGAGIPMLSRKYADFRKRYLDYCCSR